MPRQLKRGDKVKGHEILEHLNTSAMANAFAARAPSGQKVFLKSYKSPSCAVDWYRGYIEYQRELKRRLDTLPVGRFCVALLEQFEVEFGVPTFFQTFEFVSGGEDLGQILDRLRKKPGDLAWDQRLILAKVMMAGIHQLHEAKVVHGDLKPPNLQLFADRSIKAGWQLKLIDMDFSILADRPAPWHGKAAYVGTPRYFSPEHLEGKVPVPSSDVFTCGLILYELLAEGHPYLTTDDESYLRAAKAFRATAPKLQGRLADDAPTRALAECLHRCLSPDVKKRPTAKDVNLALNGRSPFAPATRSRTEPARPAPPPKRAAALKLVGASGTTLEVRIPTAVSAPLLKLKGFGAEAEYADKSSQFRVESRDGKWIVIPSPATTNATFLNGAPVEREAALNDGDTLAVGSRKSGRSVLPLKVRFCT